MSYLGKCAYCGQPVFQLHLKTGPQGPNDIDWRPWSIEDETEPTHDHEGKPLTTAKIRQWREERPYRLGLVMIDLQRGTYESATMRPRGKLRYGKNTVLHRMHWCESKEKAFYGAGNYTATMDPGRDENGQQAYGEVPL